eukprot:gene8696-643_t
MTSIPPVGPPPPPKNKSQNKVIKKKIVKKPPPEKHDYNEALEFSKNLRKLYTRKIEVVIESQKKFIAKKEVKIVHISDTHLKMDDFIKKIEPCDILIHTGDITNAGGNKELKDFNDALGKCTQAKHKVIIGGNHDFYENLSVEEIQKLLTNGIYLFESSVTIEGIKIWGAPWVPFNQMAFTPKEDTKELWKKVPEDCDILMTHCPPHLIMDLACDSERKSRDDCDQCGCSHIHQDHWGCFNLIDEIFQRIRPVVHCFGHVHELYGSINWNGVCFVNSATRPTTFKFKVFDDKTKKLFEIERNKLCDKFKPRTKLRHQKVQYHKILDFSNKKIDDTELWYWIEAILIARNNYCEEINFSNNKITDNGAYFIGELMEKTKLLTKIDISGNKIEDYAPILAGANENLTLREFILPEDAPKKVVDEIRNLMKRNHKFLSE